MTTTLPTILSGLGLLLAYAGFQFGLFRWLIGRIDLLGSNFKEELIRHQQADIDALREVRIELQAVRAIRIPKVSRKRAQ
jgi:hypothetical protein